MGNDTAKTIDRTKTIVNAASAVSSSSFIAISAYIRHERICLPIFIYIMAKILMEPPLQVTSK